MKMATAKAVLAVTFLFMAQMAYCAPGVINYQGKISNASGQPITTPVDITFTFWNAETLGAQIGAFTDADTVTPDATGVYSTLIGDDPGNLIPDAVFATDQVYLNVHINGEDLAPRKRFTTTPYAVKADSAPWSGLTSVPAGFADGVDNSNTYTAGSGLTLLHNAFSVKFQSSGTSQTASRADHDHWGQVWKKDKNGLKVDVTTATTNSYAIEAISRLQGSALRGIVVPFNASIVPTMPTGVFGATTVAPASGVSWGVFGTSTSNSGIGVYGEAPTTAVKGTSYATSGVGVQGVAIGSGGIAVKARGTAYGVSAIGATGVYGISNTSSGNGVVGRADTGANAYGVYGGSTSGYAGYFGGKVHVAGTLTKAGGSFKIDHPLDPTHKYLQHSFVESPDMKNIYDGVATLDAAGKATIPLPDWFQALNRDFRYQLTCIGGYAPVYVEKEVADNQFSIAGGTSGLKVSWQVTGIRKDAWAEKNRIPIESTKPDEEQGTYLYPAGFGKTESLSVEAAHAAVKRRAMEVAPKASLQEKSAAYVVRER